MEHVLTMANLKLKPSIFIPRSTVRVYRAYAAWVQWRAQDVVSGGGGGGSATFPFPPNT